VVVSLRLDCAEARLLGVETHVCELQLVLADLEPPAAAPEVRPPPTRGRPLAVFQ
jgi:hypothetical protein